MKIINSNPHFFQKKHANGIKAVMKRLKRKGSTAHVSKGPSATSKRSEAAEKVKAIILSRPTATQNQMAMEAGIHR